MPILIRTIFIYKIVTLAILLTGCTHVVKTTKAKPPTPNRVLDIDAITDASKKSYFKDRSYLADGNPGYYLVAGRYVWMFYDDYLIIKSASEETRIPYKRYKPSGECIQPKRRIHECKTNPCARLAIKIPKPVPRDCVPRTIFGQRVGDFGRPTPNGRRKWKKNGLPGFWVIEDRVVVTLGDMQYYYKYDGTFIERKKNELDWDLKIGPYAKYEWKIERTKGKISNLHFKDLEFEASSVQFSGPWVVIHLRNRYQLIDRTTGEVKAKYNRTKVRLRRDQDRGFYIDEKNKRAPNRPSKWYGETIVDLQDENPQKYCYVFKGKKKCVLTPKMSPTKKRCFPNRKCVPRPQWAKIYKMVETDDLILKYLPGRIEITFDKLNYYTKTHHYTDERFKQHLRDHLFWRKMWRDIPIRKPLRRKNK